MAEKMKERFRVSHAMSGKLIFTNTRTGSVWYQYGSGWILVNPCQTWDEWIIDNKKPNSFYP